MAFSNRKSSTPYSSIAGLNTLPSEYDLALQQQQDDFRLDEELDLFTNANFFTWDTGDNGDQGFDQLAWQGAPAGGPGGEVTGDDQFPDLGPITGTESLQSQQHSQPEPLLHQQYPSPPALAPALAPAHLDSTTTTTTTPPRGLKRRLSITIPLEPMSPTTTTTVLPNDELEDPNDPDENALDISAEEDKRRRNTAASARFRVKKKQREQAMEKTAKEMTDKVSALEGRVGELEKENLLLKGLLVQVQKGGSGGGGELGASLGKRAKVVAVGLGR